MLTAWIDEKKLDDRLLDFRKQFLGGIETFAGKSLRPFFWHGELPKHVFGLDTFMTFLGAIEILVLTDLEQFQIQNNKNIQYFYNATRNPTILFGETAKHEIQKFDFYKIESMPFQSKIRNGFVSGEIDANASIPETSTIHEIQTQNSKIKDYLLILKEWLNYEPFP